MEKKISTTKDIFAHKSFIETEFSHGCDAKKTWLACQGYYDEDNPSGIVVLMGELKMWQNVSES